MGLGGRYCILCLILKVYKNHPAFPLLAAPGPCPPLVHSPLPPSAIPPHTNVDDSTTYTTRTTFMSRCIILPDALYKSVI